MSLTVTEKDWIELENREWPPGNSTKSKTMENLNSSKKVTVDQECWIRDRLYTLVRMALSIREQHLKGADDDMYYDAIHGAVNGCAIEIIRHAGLENIYANLSEVKRILL